MFVSKIINNSNSYLIHTSSNYIVKPTVLIDSWETSYSDSLFVGVESSLLNEYNFHWALPPLNCIYNEFNILNADEILNTINLISNCDCYIYNNNYRFVVSLLNLCLFNK